MRANLDSELINMLVRVVDIVDCELDHLGQEMDHEYAARPGVDVVIIHRLV